MTHNLLIIDANPQHRQVMRRFIEKVHPDVRLSEYNPVQSGMPGANFDWSEHDLLLLDNELGEHDMLTWLKSASRSERFPPFIVLSSTLESDSAEAMESVIRCVRLGAVDYLFKKKIRLEKLNKRITEVLDKAPPRPDKQEQQVAAPKATNTAQIAVREMQDAIENTQHEIHLAMAMIDGRTDWPFTMEDILAGRAFIKDYKVVSYLGNEMAGATFKVRHKGDGDPQIMYFIRGHKNKDGSLPEALQHELKVMMHIDHPGILPISDYQMVNDDVLLIRSMIDGETLEHILKTKGVYEAQAIDLFRQIIAGLIELHQHKLHLGHCTPKSLRIAPDGTLVFADTGLINRLHAITSMTGEFSSQDAPMYATPERIQGRTVDTRSDIYLAGLIGYEMLAGVPVYHKGSIKDILYAHVTEPIPDLPDSSHPLNTLFKEMLQKTPSKRIQSAEAVLSRLNVLVGQV